jgi:hypothetical protein
LIRCTQYEHFSITPRARTETSGFMASFRMSGVSFGEVVEIEVTHLIGQLFEQ